MALSDYCTGKTTVAVRTGSGTVVRGGPRRVRALKEVEEAEELAEVLLRRRYAQDVRIIGIASEAPQEPGPGGARAACRLGWRRCR